MIQLQIKWQLSSQAAKKKSWRSGAPSPRTGGVSGSLKLSVSAVCAPAEKPPEVLVIKSEWAGLLRLPIQRYTMKRTHTPFTMVH